MKAYVYDNTYVLVNNLLTFWVDYARDCIEHKGSFTVALSGGKTPIEFYTRLSSVDRFDLWSNTYIFLTDERMVPPDHADSNLRLINDHLLAFVPIPEKNVFPVPTNTDSAETSALYYEGMLEEFFRLPVGSLPRFDLILLGLGEDGHTASLFPKQEHFEEPKRLTISAKPPHAEHDRISLSLPVINAAHKAIFLVTGKSKAAVIKSVYGQDQRLPATHVQPAHGEAIYFLDAEAARSLPKDAGNNVGEALILGN